ncbi:hypothetical protein D3C85_1302690 [compost metagenome]
MASNPVTVNVLPNGVVTDCGKPAATPSVTTAIPPKVRVCTPSGAVMVKVPFWVSAELSASLPSLRFFSKTVSSPPLTLNPPIVIGSSLFWICSTRFEVLVSPSASVSV